MSNASTNSDQCHRQPRMSTRDDLRRRILDSLSKPLQVANPAEITPKKHSSDEVALPANFELFSIPEPSTSEIKAEVQRQILVGAMTELRSPLTPSRIYSPTHSQIHAEDWKNAESEPKILVTFDPSQPVFVPAPTHAEAWKPADIEPIATVPDIKKLPRLPPFKYSSWPFWIIAFLCSIWLGISLGDSLGGTPGAYIVGFAFEFSPMILMGAKVTDPRTRDVASISAISIFIIGAILFMTPHFQTAWNEYEKYSSAKSAFQIDLKNYQSASRIVTEAEAKYSASKRDYETKVTSLGSLDNATAKAKKQMEKDLAAWSEKLKQSPNQKIPESPNLSDSLRAAIQELGLRVGLFVIVYALMYVMRGLDSTAEILRRVEQN